MASQRCRPSRDRGKSHARRLRGRPADRLAVDVFARVLYTHYCAFELSTRIFASHQRLAHGSHILEFEMRSPHWKRVAIVRREFFQRLGAGFRAPLNVVGTQHLPAAPSSPTSALSACSAVAGTAREPRFHSAGHGAVAPAGIASTPSDLRTARALVTRRRVRVSCTHARRRVMHVGLPVARSAPAHACTTLSRAV
jgi:hypothetical protein